MPSKRIEVGDDIAIKKEPRKRFEAVYGSALGEVFTVTGEDSTGGKRILFVGVTPSAVYASDAVLLRTKAEREAKPVAKLGPAEICGGCSGMGHYREPPHETCTSCGGSGKVYFET